MFRILCNNVFFGVATIHIIYVEAPFSYYFAECPNLKFRLIEYMDVMLCKTGTDVDVMVLCPKSTMVRDLPIKWPPATYGLGCELREDAWRIRHRMYNGNSSGWLTSTHNFIII